MTKFIGLETDTTQRYRHEKLKKKARTFIWKIKKIKNPTAWAWIDSRTGSARIQRVLWAGHYNRLPKHGAAPKNTHKKHIMVTLAPSIDPVVPTRELCTYKRKKSRHNNPPITTKHHLQRVPPSNKPHPLVEASATIPIQVAVSETN